MFGTTRRHGLESKVRWHWTAIAAILLVFFVADSISCAQSDQIFSHWYMYVSIGLAAMSAVVGVLAWIRSPNVVTFFLPLTIFLAFLGALLPNPLQGVQGAVGVLAFFAVIWGDALMGGPVPVPPPMLEAPRHPYFSPRVLNWYWTLVGAVLLLFFLIDFGTFMRANDGLKGPSSIVIAGLFAALTSLGIWLIWRTQSNVALLLGTLSFCSLFLCGNLASFGIRSLPEWQMSCSIGMIFLCLFGAVTRSVRPQIAAESER